MACCLFKPFCLVLVAVLPTAQRTWLLPHASPDLWSGEGIFLAAAAAVCCCCSPSSSGFPTPKLVFAHQAIMHRVAAVATAACNLRCLACGLLLLPLLLLSAACVAAAAWCWFCLQFTAAICSLLVAACVAVAACGLVLFCMHFQLLLQTVVLLLSCSLSLFLPATCCCCGSLLLLSAPCCCRCRLQLTLLCMRPDAVACLTCCLCCRLGASLLLHATCCRSLAACCAAAACSWRCSCICLVDAVQSAAADAA